MDFLPTIEEAEESEELLQEPEVQGEEASNEPFPHGSRKSRQETDSETHKAVVANSEKEPLSQEKRARKNSSSGTTSPAAVKELGRPQDDRSSSVVKNTRRCSLTRTRSKRGSCSAANRLTALGGSQRRSASGPPFSRSTHDISRRSAGRITRSTVGMSDAQAPTSLTRIVEEDSSTAPKRGRRQRTTPNSEHADLPAPQWVINLMLDIEEATRHQLTVE